MYRVETDCDMSVADSGVLLRVTLEAISPSSSFLSPTDRGFQELLCDSLLIEELIPSTSPSPPPYIDQPALANLLGTLPPKHLCDIFLSSFWIGVRPVLPLFHGPIFQQDYNDCWDWFTKILAGSYKHPKLKHLEDPTYLCLIISVVYCGAATASSYFWKVNALQGVNRDVIIAQLHQSYLACQNICQHTRHPTQNTLVASLLAHECSAPGRGGAEDQDFVSKIIRMAQSMGMHRDGTVLSFDLVSCEVRRRIWWHIIWLDVQVSIRTGLPTLCNIDSSQQDVRMASETRDGYFVSQNGNNELVSPSQSVESSSAVMLLAIGQYETARFEHTLVSFCNGTREIDKARFDEFAQSMKNLHFHIDDIIGKIHAQGVPEKGLIPSRLLNAGPLVNEDLYSEKASEPTVFGAWARILLTMLKAESSLLLQKCLLESPCLSKEATQSTWDSIIRDSTAYLQHYLQLNSIPSFEPYAWCLKNHRTPLQCVLLILVYMHSHRDSLQINVLRYFVDELLDCFAPEGASHPKGEMDKKFLKTDTETAAAWRRLRAIRTKLNLL